jgi:hypothetical protein
MSSIINTSEIDSGVDVRRLSFDDVSKRLLVRKVSGDNPGDGSVRQEILSQSYKFTYWAVQGNQVLVQGPDGRFLFTVRPDDNINGSKVVDVEFIPHIIRHSSPWKTFFWMNALSLKDLSERLRSHPEHKVLFHEIYEGKRS